MDLEREDEEATSYLRTDLYKMHAYRDAIRGARSVHILYPGSLDTFSRRMVYQGVASACEERFREILDFRS